MKKTPLGLIDKHHRGGDMAPGKRRSGARGGVLVLAILVLWLSSQARADEQYVSEEFGFSLNYPEDVYEEQPLESGSGVVFILRDRAGGFPTFTVSTGEGGYQPTSDTDHAQRVVSEYRRVGFRDAQVVKVAPYVQRGIPLQSPQVTIVFSGQRPVCERRSQGDVGHWGDSSRPASLTYLTRRPFLNESPVRRTAGTSQEGCSESRTGSEALLRSKVLTISTPSRHFTLTYMDDADRADRGDSRRLFDNFFIGTIERAVSEVTPDYRRDERRSSWEFSAHEVLGLFTPILNGVMELAFGDLRPEEPNRSVQRDRSSVRDYDRGDSFADLPRPLASDFLKSTIPASQGGRLFGLLALFVSGVLLKRLRRR